MTLTVLSHRAIVLMGDRRTIRGLVTARPAPHRTPAHVIQLPEELPALRFQQLGPRHLHRPLDHRIVDVQHDITSRHAACARSATLALISATRPSGTSGITSASDTYRPSARTDGGTTVYELPQRITAPPGSPMAPGYCVATPAPRADVKYQCACRSHGPTPRCARPPVSAPSAAHPYSSSTSPHLPQ